MSREDVLLAMTSPDSDKLVRGADFVDIMRGERAEVELDAFIERRSRKDPDADEREELWKASVRAYEEERRLQARAEWHLYHTAQAGRMRRTLEELISYHETQAERCLPKGAAS